MQRLAITPGEPAGIGPELLVRYAQKKLNKLELVAIADPELLTRTAQTLALPLELEEYHSARPQASGNGRLTIIPVTLNEAVTPGQLCRGNAVYVLETLKRASDACLTRELDGMVTGPVHKGIINQAGIRFSGHTEYLAERANCEQVVMMLACEGLRVALATTHLPLRDVANAITAEGLKRTLHILHNDLCTQFGIADPRILICGLNPHAGEDGHLGREEIDIINPVIADLRASHGWQLSDALPADTLFTPHHLAKADAVLAMYHDQGLPVLKHKGFGSAVNITLGLPFIRTSVDHGTALDLVGKNIADLGSLTTAVTTAQKMAAARHSAAPERE